MDGAMITIHKYPLSLRPEQTLDLPGIPHFLHVGLDAGGVPCLWAKVDTRYENLRHIIFTVGTGSEVPARAGNYLGTFNKGPDIAHIFTQ